jgi:hypothetical protein
VGEAKLPRADRNPTIFKQRSSKSGLQTTIFKLDSPAAAAAGDL